MKALIEVEIKRKEFIENICTILRPKKYITKAMKEYLVDSLYESIEDWVKLGDCNIPTIKFKEVNK